jgi:hypothetical protein
LIPIELADASHDLSPVNNLNDCTPVMRTLSVSKTANFQPTSLPNIPDATSFQPGYAGFVFIE